MRRHRSTAGLTQDELAARLQVSGWDISRTGLAKVESGLRLVIDAELIVLGRVLGCSPLELFKGVKPSVVDDVVRQGRR